MYRQGEHLGVMNWLEPGKWNDMNRVSARKSGVKAAILERLAPKSSIGVSEIHFDGPAGTVLRIQR